MYARVGREGESMNLLDLVLNEDLWFAPAALIALAAMAFLIRRYRSGGISKRTTLTCGLNLFYGLLIGIMGVGHLLAVSIKTAMGTLPAGTNRWFIFPLGLALAVPAWWLVACVKGLRDQRRTIRRLAIALNLWLGALLLPLGSPLAAPAAINVLCCGGSAGVNIFCAGRLATALPRPYGLAAEAGSKSAGDP